MPHGGDGERQVARDRSVTMAQGRYWIALFKKGGESTGVEHELARHDELDLARSIYRQMIANYPARLVHAMRPRETVGPQRSLCEPIFP